MLYVWAETKDNCHTVILYSAVNKKCSLISNRLDGDESEQFLCISVKRFLKMLTTSNLESNDDNGKDRLLDTDDFAKSFREK